MCDELLSERARSNRHVRAQRAAATDRGRYWSLHPDGRDLIRKWLDRARQPALPDSVSPFEEFIYAWIAFNGWAACVTQLDTDREWLDALILNAELASDFQRALNVPAFAAPAEDFRGLWPIFEVRALRRRQVTRVHAGDRAAIVAHYLGANVTEFQPACFTRHRDAGEHVPIDWPHAVSALYRVRCNLFHGEKALDSENDRRVVASAFRLLLACFDELRLLDHARSAC